MVACIGLYSFAMQCKEQEHHDDPTSTLSPSKDPFVVEGLFLSSDSNVNMTVLPTLTKAVGYLQAGKAHCKKLKEQLFHAKMW